MLLKSICKPLVGHNSALEIVIFSFCEVQWKRYSNTAPASAINVMQQYQISGVTEKVLRTLYFGGLTQHELCPGAINCAAAAVMH